jgi:hypothetical protein
MNPEFRQLVLTVFNVRLHFGSNQAPSEEWLRHRFQLFEQLCYPAMRAQSNQNFRWVALLDEGTPAEFRARIDRCREWENFIPHYTDQVMSVESFAAMRKALISRYVGPSEYLITTTLDNDDCLHRDYVATIQEQFSKQQYEFVNFADGFALDYQRERLYLKHDLTGPFVSLIEKSGDAATTVWLASHRELHRYGAVRQIAGRPMWIQVIHGRNAVNSLDLFRRVPVTDLGEGFSTTWTRRKPVESGIAIVAENAVNAILRVPRSLRRQGS